MQRQFASRERSERGEVLDLPSFKRENPRRKGGATNRTPLKGKKKSRGRVMWLTFGRIEKGEMTGHLGDSRRRRKILPVGTQGRRGREEKESC